MKERDAGKKTRSSVTGNVIKMKVRKSSEDKQVCHRSYSPQSITRNPTLCCFTNSSLVVFTDGT